MKPSIVSSVALLAGLLVGCVAEVDSTTLPTDEDEPPQFSEAALMNSRQTAFNYFVTKGLTEAQSAGIVGNLMQESSVSPTAVEYGGGPGRGIAQWSVGGRWDRSAGDNVTSYASQHGVSRWSLQTQLDFIWFELTTKSYGLSALRASSTVTAATLAFMRDYEICGTCASSKRISYAQQVLADYGGHAGGGGGGGGGGSSGATCYSSTLGRDMPENACVQSKFDSAWYQCNNGSWVDRWSDPDACSSVHPL